MRFCACVLAVLWVSPAFADDEITPDQAARVSRDRDKAMDEVAKKHGHKKSNELSSDERREMMREQAAATNAAYEKNGVSAKAFERYEATTDLRERAAQKAAADRLAKQEAEDQKNAASTDQGAKEIPIQRGFSDANPVTLEDQGNANGPVTVEKGLPAEAQDDQNQAGSESAAARPSKASSPSKSKRR